MSINFTMTFRNNVHPVQVPCATLGKTLQSKRHNLWESFLSIRLKQGENATKMQGAIGSEIG